MGYQATMMRRSLRPAGTSLVLLALVASCSSKLAGPDENIEATRAALATLAAPLEVQGFQVVNADGFRSVFFKLSRLPDSVTSFSETDPARIVMELKGPTGQEVPEQFFPGNDSYVTYVRISVSYGLVRVVMDLNAATPPAYAVLPMADWVMVRLGAVQSSSAAPESPSLPRRG